MGFFILKNKIFLQTNIFVFENKKKLMDKEIT